MTKQEYDKLYTKEKLHAIRVYVQKDKFPKIKEHAKTKGYSKMSDYIKNLIEADMDSNGGAK